MRVIAATNRDLEREIDGGPLPRRPLPSPRGLSRSACRRCASGGEDIPLLAAHFLDAARRRLGVGPLRLSEEAKQRLQDAPWPGNVRELENVISRAVLRASAPGRAGSPGTPIQIGEELLDLGPGGPRPTAWGAPDLEGPPASPSVGQMPGSLAALDAPASAAEVSGSFRRRTQAFQRRVIEAAVERRQGNWAAAARDLGLHRSNLHHLARRLGMRE